MQSPSLPQMQLQQGQPLQNLQTLLSQLTRGAPIASLQALAPAVMAPPPMQSITPPMTSSVPLTSASQSSFSSLEPQQQQEQQTSLGSSAAQRPTASPDIGNRSPVHSALAASVGTPHSSSQTLPQSPRPSQFPDLRASPVQQPSSLPPQSASSGAGPSATASGMEVEPEPQPQSQLRQQQARPPHEPKRTGGLPAHVSSGPGMQLAGEMAMAPGLAQYIHSYSGGLDDSEAGEGGGGQRDASNSEGQ